jgi:hypothetical protein
MTNEQQQRPSSYERLTASGISAPDARAENAAIDKEVATRGVPRWQVKREHYQAHEEMRVAEAERVRALLADPARVAALKAATAPRPFVKQMLPDGTIRMVPPPPLPPLADLLAPPDLPSAPSDPNAPPSGGRVINPPRRKRKGCKRPCRRIRKCHP